MITELFDYEDLSVETNNIPIKQLCETHNLKNVIKKPTCFKSTEINNYRWSSVISSSDLLQLANQQTEILTGIIQE